MTIREIKAAVKMGTMTAETAKAKLASIAATVPGPSIVAIRKGLKFTGGTVWTA
jgi:hypothetical protein